MFNDKILSYVNKLLIFSEKGMIQWAYNSDEVSIFAKVKDNALTITYLFDENRELGLYRLDIASEGNEASYTVWDGENGFDQCRQLIDIASSNKFDLNLSEDDFS